MKKQTLLQFYRLPLIWILLPLCVITAAAIKNNVDKDLTVKARVEEWNKHLTKLEMIRSIADQSSMNHQEVKFISATIDSIELMVVPQLRAQIDATKDSTKKK
jgi:hypothetical protein